MDLPLVALCLVFSGAGSLVLEVAWSRMLKLVFGSTTLAIATILVAYMLGLGLGGLWGGRLARRVQRGIRLYGLFEIAVGLYALAVPHFLDLLPSANGAGLAGLGFWPAALLRFAIVMLFLLLPTLLMGATLPVLVAALARERADLARRVGLLYGMNTLGAVAGVVGATFLFFPWLGLYRTNALGAALDLGVGVLAAFVLAPRLTSRTVRPSVEPEQASPEGTAEGGVPGNRRFSLPLLAYALVGFTALGYEVAWTRALSMITGASIYAFALMLAAFLCGIALGSLIFRRFIDRWAFPRAAFGAGVGLLGLLALATVLSFSALPGLFVLFIELVGFQGSSVILGALAVSFLAMLGPTLALGALFPLVVRSCAAPRGETSRVVADAYFLNTIGSASGAFAAGFLLIPGLGLRHTMGALLALNFATAALVVVWQREWKGPRKALAAGAAGAAALLVLVFPPFWDAARMTTGVFYNPDRQITFGIPLEPYEDHRTEEMLFYKDGLNTSVSVHRAPGGIALRLGGKPDASLADMSTQVLAGHLPFAFGGPVRKALVIGYASGVTTGSAALYEPERVEAVELEPAVIQASRFFDPYNHAPQENPRVRVIVEDGRSYLASSSERYEVIISEPSNPWISGASSLFTREFFRLAREHLAPEGRLLQWIQLYGMDSEALLSVWRALRAEFRYIYGFQAAAHDPDLLLLATNEPLGPEDLPRWEALPGAVQADLRRINIFSTADLWSLLQITPREIDTLAGDASGPVNTDDSMFVELRAPWTIYNDAALNLRQIDAHRNGVLAILDRAGEPALPPRLLGELAYSSLARRENMQISAAALARAAAAGRTGAAAATVAEAILRDQDLAADQRPARARALLDEALATDPQDVTARSLRAALRYYAGELPGAYEDASAVLAADPERFPIRQLRVRVQGAMGRFPEAWSDARPLLSPGLADLHPSLWSTASPAAAASGDLAAAAEAMQRFLTLEPHSEPEWRILGEIQRSRGRAGLARVAEANAGRAGRNTTALLHREALRQAAFGSPENARRLLETVIARDPSNQRAREELERLRRGER